MDFPKKFYKIALGIFMPFAVIVYLIDGIAEPVAISKAKNLSLQRDRLQATKVLRDAIQRETINSSKRKGLTKALDKFSSMFYTAKTLQVYETGRSLFGRNELQAIENFEEAQKLEPINIKPMIAIAEYRLRENECEEAMDWTRKASEIHPFHQQVKYLNLFSLACLGEYKKIQALESDLKRSINKNYFYLSLAQAYLKESEWDAATSSLSKVVDKNIPEYHYFLGIVKRSKDDEDYLQDFANYVSLCRDKESLSRKYKFDPRICKESANLKKKYQLPTGGSLQKVVR